jgi:hypothetical protein
MIIGRTAVMASSATTTTTTTTTAITGASLYATARHGHEKRVVKRVAEVSDAIAVLRDITGCTTTTTSFVFISHSSSFSYFSFFHSGTATTTTTTTTTTWSRGRHDAMHGRRQHAAGPVRHGVANVHDNGRTRVTLCARREDGHGVPRRGVLASAFALFVSALVLAFVRAGWCVEKNLEARLARPLKEQRDAAVVAVRAGAHVNGGIVAVTAVAAAAAMAMAITWL